MREEFINAFVDTAIQVLQVEAKIKILDRGQVVILNSKRTSGEVTLFVALAGGISGVVLYTMSEETALKIVSLMSGEPARDFDEMAQSALSELANIITGNAFIALESAGCPCTLTPPMLIIGKNTQIAVMDVNRSLVSLQTDAGIFEIDLALREKK